MASNTQESNTVDGPQNIYDTQQFFDGYVQLPRQVEGLDGAPEWPCLRSMLPPLDALRILDLGCGMGWFARWAIENGAAKVHGVDLSENMLNRARSMTASQNITYQRADMDELTLPGTEYDLVFSSLAFHYLLELPRLFREIHKSLADGGKIVFTVEHPIFLGPTRGGLITDSDGRKIWPLDAYQREGPRLRNWFVNGVKKQHRTLGTYINLLLATGFELTDFVEWCPTAEDLVKFPDWETEFIRPTFLLIGATKKAEIS
ncbi:methyltransferase type 11 [Xylariales sp. PMI_506]|nr:methyltransferase type 11 [Xylariales sp. PMI_506]